MKSALVITRPTAASTSAAIEACCALRSTNGTLSTRLFLAPDVRALVEALEAHELVDVLDLYRRAAGDDDARLDVFGDHAARADQRAGADLQPRQDGGVRADADVVLDRRAEHAVEVARAHGVRVVGEHDVRPKEHPRAERGVLEETPAVYPRAVADAVAGFEHGVGPDAAVVADHVVLADHRAVAAAEAIADHSARIDHRARADGAAGADRRLDLARLLSPRRLADDGAVLHHRALAELHVWVDHARPARAAASWRRSRS